MTDNSAPKTKPKAHLPDESLAYLTRAVRASRAGNESEAMSLFEQACATGPGHPLPSFLYGSELASLGRIEQAESAFANAVLCDPGFNTARYQLGLLQFSSGRAAAALVSWQPLLVLADTNPMLHFVYGFAALARNEYSAARTHFHEGLALPNNNGPMIDDIRLVLARMDEEAASTGEPATHAEPAAPQTPAGVALEEPAEPDARHVLISNYGKPDTLH
ncbi:hypothetical protein [Caenimonas koreensis]|uniref:hypothetical protein n=1 Tax=Caenimonas koreensis TaxID=367474 RepID=UPI00378345D3